MKKFVIKLTIRELPPHGKLEALRELSWHPMACNHEMPDLSEKPTIQRKTPAMPLRIYPVIDVLLMLLFAGNHEARAQYTCATAVAIEHDSTHSITMLPGIDRVWLTFTTDSTAKYLAFTSGMNFTGFDTIIVYTGNCGQLTHHLSVGSTDSAVMIHFVDTVQQYFIEIVRSSASDTGQIIVLKILWFPFAISPPGICNLLSNSDFETLNPAAVGYQGTTGEISIQRNFLTDWRYAWGTPNIVPKETWDPMKNHAVFLWNVNDLRGEGIFQDFSGLIHNNKYRFFVDVQNGGLSEEPILVAAFTNVYTPTPQNGPGGAGNIPQGYLQKHEIVASTLNNLSSTHFTTYNFPLVFDANWSATPGNPQTRITIYNRGDNGGGAAMIIDNVKIVPDEEVLLSITACNIISASLTGNYSNVQYDWYVDPSMTNLILQNSATFYGGGYPNPTTIWVRATYHNGECTANASITLTTPPEFSAMVDFIELCIPAKTSDNFNIHINGGVPPYSYSWSSGPGISNTTSQTPDVSVLILGTHSYTVTITDALGCQIFAQGLVTVYDGEPIEITGTRSICDKTKVFYEYSVANPNPSAVYTWALNAGSWGVSIVNSNNHIAEVAITSLPQLPDFVELIVTGNAGSSCETKNIYRIYDCCYVEDYFGLIDEELTQTKLDASPSMILLQGVIEVNSSVTVSAHDFLMGPEAKILINPGGSLHFDLNSYQTALSVRQGCGVMWDGIFVEDISAVVTVENTLVQDALQAVVSKNGGIFNITNSTFQNNLVGVFVKDYYALAPATPLNNHPGEVTGTAFTSTGNLTLPPKAGEKPLCGIRTRFVSDLTIGNNGADKNLFENMAYGILSLNSNLTLYHNEFDNNRPEPLSVFNGLTGAVSAEFNYGDLSAYQISPEINIVGQSNQVRNVFQNGYKGVQSRNIKMVVTDNYFHNHTHYGINGVDIKDETQITGNEVLGAFTGIKLTNAAKSRINVTVDNNVVKNVNRGIHTINLGGDRYGGKRLLITYNEIRPDRITREKRSIGIYVESSPHSHVFCNSIYLPPPIIHKNSRDSVIGIWMSQTENAAIANNNVLLFGYGIFTTGVQFNNRFFCNTLDNCYHGFFFGPDTRLTDQGWANIPNKTDWVPHNAFFNDIAGYQRMETDYGNILTSSEWYYMDNQGSNYEIDMYPNSKCCHFYMGLQPIEGILNNNATHSCLYTNVNNCIPDLETMSNDSTLSPEERDWLYQAYLEMDELLQQINHEYYCYSAEYLFSTLFQDSSLMYLGGGLDSEYKEFYDSLKNEPLSRFITVEQMIRNGRYHEALVENLAIVPKNTLETYRQEVYRIYLTQFCMNQFTLAPEDSTYLFNIATLTPYYGGYGVYTARVMLGIDIEDYGVPYRKPDPAKQGRANLVKVFPNPASQLLTIELSEDGEPVSGFVEFYNIYGQLIQRSPISHHSTNLAVNMFPPGVLFYRVVNRGHMVGSGKVVITK